MFEKSNIEAHVLAEIIIKEIEVGGIKGATLYQRIDNATRQWLNKKVETLASFIKWKDMANSPDSLLKEILGLESEVKECEQCNNPMRKGTHAPWCNTTGFEKPMEEMADECVINHSKHFENSPSNKFCHGCGVPRPKQKSLEQKFYDYMNTFSTHIKVQHYHDKEGRISEEQVFHKAQFKFVSEKLAKIAEEHFKEEPKR